MGSLNWITSKDKMIINGISSDRVGLYVDTPYMPPMPELNANTFNTGSEESTIINELQFQDITITVTGFLFESRYNPYELYRYLISAKKLSFSTNPRIYYRVKHVYGVSPQYAGMQKNRLEMQFVCSPFRYAVTNQKMAYTNDEPETEKTVSIYNQCPIFINPVYKATDFLSGATGIEITVNSEKVTFTLPATPPDTFVIDIDNQTVYGENSGSKVNVFSNVSGKWWNFFLNPGYTDIAIKNFGSLEIIKNERWI